MPHIGHYIYVGARLMPAGDACASHCSATMWRNALNGLSLCLRNRTPVIYSNDVDSDAILSQIR